MSSSDSRERPDATMRDEVNRAQRGPRERGVVDFAAYLRFLSELPAADPAELRKRPLLRGEPFRL
jgi:hypothetical protein